MLPTLLATFESDAARLLKEARQATEQGQHDNLRRAAHSLKSTSATFGGLRLSSIAREIEQRACESRLEGLAEWLSKAEVEFIEFMTELRFMMKE